MSISNRNDCTPISNPVIEALLDRRSCRSFKPDPIDASVLKTIVTCGQYAATARGTEPWHITVIEDMAYIDHVAEAVRLGMRESGVEMFEKRGADESWHCFYHTPALVILSRKDGEDYGDIDCANVAQNMCVAAQSLDVGSCINGLFRWAFRSSANAALREKLRIPSGYTPTLSITLGYPDQAIIGHPNRDDEKIDYLNRSL